MSTTVQNSNPIQTDYSLTNDDFSGGGNQVNNPYQPPSIETKEFWLTDKIEQETLNPPQIDSKTDDSKPKFNPAPAKAKGNDTHPKFKAAPAKAKGNDTHPKFTAAPAKAKGNDTHPKFTAAPAKAKGNENVNGSSDNSKSNQTNNSSNQTSNTNNQTNNTSNQTNNSNNEYSSKSGQELLTAFRNGDEKLFKALNENPALMQKLIDQMHAEERFIDLISNYNKSKDNALRTIINNLK